MIKKLVEYAWKFSSQDINCLKGILMVAQEKGESVYERKDCSSDNVHVAVNGHVDVGV
jgi:hypothetical protein